jgi:Tfp pilus assembly protein PilF
MLGYPGSLLAQESSASDELAQLLATLKRKAEDFTLAIGQREAIVQEMASALDRAAQRSSDPGQKQARWSQAIDLLDAFRDHNKGHPRNREFQLQAAVFRWAQGQSWGEFSTLNPGDTRSAERANTALDDAITRLRAISQEGIENVLGDNVRFRLAQALADRAEREPADSPRRQSEEADALELLRQPVSEPGLMGFAGLLKAELLRRSGRVAEASVALDSAVKTDPPPPEREALDVRIAVLSGQGKFGEAAAAVQASHLGEPAKKLALVQLRLGQLAALPSGADRFAIENELFQLVGDLRARPSSETRLALVALGARPIDPSPRHEPVVWDLLAEAKELYGDADGAAALEERAAARAQEQGKPEAAADFLLRGGGFLFQAGKYAQADAVLSRVADDPRAGSRRAKAGMLRCLARGRALAGGLPGATPASYAEALRRQILEYPGEPTTDEARWLLGSLTLASGEPDKAQQLWNQIAPGSSRWIDARLAVADVERKALESQLKIGDHAALMAGYRRASENLTASLEQARTDADKAALWLAQARLNAVPTVGRSQLALALVDRLGRLPLSPVDRYRTRLLRMIIRVEVGPPYLESEREAQSHSAWAEPSARWAFLDAARLIDECATHSEVVLGQRRFGLILRLLLQPAAQENDEEKWSASERSEIKLRLTRAYLFLGDDIGARATLRTWGGLPPSASDELLGDLADTYNRLEAYELAIDVQRLRSKNLTTGSPSWFEARYGLALAYFHSSQLKEAAQLIDATAILHPNLGGGIIEKKFIKLRQRLGSNP